MERLTYPRAPRALLVAIALLVTTNSIAIGLLWERTSDQATPSPDPSPRTSVLGETFEPPPLAVPQVDPPSFPDASAADPPDPPTVVTAPELPAPPPPAPRCRRSHDPACGPLFWDPEPEPNEPMTMDAWYEPDTPVAGEPVTFMVISRDSDARPLCCRVSIDGAIVLSAWRECGEERYGAWEPPRRTGGRDRSTYTHTFRDPGSYEITFGGHSGGWCPNPYASAASVTITFVVGEAPADPEAA